MQHAVLEKTKIKGRYVISFYDTRSEEAQAIEREIESHIANRPANTVSLEAHAHRVKYTELINRLSKFKTREYAGTNLIATVGRSVIAQRLAGTVTYTGTVNYGALGTGTTAPANGNTQLVTEVFRKVVASASYTNNTAFIDFFYSKSDTNGTYQEFGTFIDGTATANSGQLFTRTLTGGWVKTSSESMTVAVQYDVN